MLILNGHIYKPGAPEVTLLNRSFKYGDGIFEDLRVWDGQILFLEDHLERLVEGMKVLQYQFDAQDWCELIKQELYRAIKVNDLGQHGRLRLQVYRAGTGGFTPLENHPMYLIEAYSLKENYYEHATSVSLTFFRSIPLYYSPLSNFKTANSLPHILAAHFARDHNFDEALLMCNGYISQTSNYHIFIIKERKIFTPPLKSACTDGIMRKHIMLICKELKLKHAEKRLKISQIKQADEVFLANTLRGIVAVKQFGKIQFIPSAFTLVPFLQNSLLRYVRGKYGV